MTIFVDNHLKSFVLDELLDSIHNEKSPLLIVVTNIT